MSTENKRPARARRPDDNEATATARPAARRNETTGKARSWVLLQGEEVRVVESDDRPSTEVEPGARMIRLEGPYSTTEAAERRAEKLRANTPAGRREGMVS